jgi:DNA repair exonuclease SbcCD ATPase subunit
MWIERIDFIGFGSLAGEKIEFKPNKVNLIVEPNDYGKSTIADALWAVIFGFSPEHAVLATGLRDMLKPAGGRPYIVCMDLVAGKRPLKIIRDFNDGSVQVIDRAADNQDVTAQFTSGQRKDDVGRLLAGVSREAFCATFYTAQRQLTHNGLSDNADVLALLSELAEDSTSPAKAQAALNLLNDTISSFDYRGEKAKLDAILRDLQLRQRELKAKVKTQEKEREELSTAYARLASILAQSVDATLAARSKEYFDLCLHVADLDNQMMKSRGKSGRRGELQAEVMALQEMQDFPMDVSDQLEDLWKKRLAKLDEYRALDARTGPSRTQFDEQKMQLRQKYPGVENLSAEDIQAVNRMAASLQNLQDEVNQLTQRRQLEAIRIRTQDSVDIERVEEMRKSLYPLDQREVESARTYDALINAARTQILECDRIIAQSQKMLAEIEEEKKTKKGVFSNVLQHRKRESDQAEREIQQQTELMHELRTKVSNLEARLDVLSQKAGLNSTGDLLKQVKEYSSKSVAVKDIDALDQVLSTRDAMLSKTKQEIAPFFAKAMRADREITAESAVQLARDAQIQAEQWGLLSAQFAPVNQMQQQVDAVGTEISDIEGLLESIFLGAQLEHPDRLDESYAEFRRRAEMARRWRTATDELAKIDHTDGTSVDKDLERRHSEAFTRMQELVRLHPEIQEMALPIEGAGLAEAKPEGNEDLEPQIEDLRARVNRFDQSYLSSLQELDTLQRDLARLHQARAAIELARETLQNLASEVADDWLSKVNAVFKELLLAIGCEVENVELTPQLKLVVDGKELSESEQVSIGIRAQLDWLARLAICLLISINYPLPIVIDETFCELDDATFLRIMHFLMDNVARENQIIVMSCHRVRYQWMLQNLSDEQKQLVAICRKSKIKTEAVTA